MCGIFGLVVSNPAALPTDRLKPAVDKLFALSEWRGKEAAGLAVLAGGELSVFKQAQRATRMIKTEEYRRFFNLAVETPGKGPSALALIGHARLVTNGTQEREENNQPVLRPGLAAVHNGIIVNVEELWGRFAFLHRRAEVDTEVLLALLGQRLAQGEPTAPALAAALEEIEGSASLAILIQERAELALASNKGSLFYAQAGGEGPWAFASERFILERALADPSLAGLAWAGPAQVRPGQGLVVGLDRSEPTRLTFQGRGNRLHAGNGRRPPRPSAPAGHPAERLQRCTRCILPETVPFIEFDSQGVCNYCRTYEPMAVKGREALERIVAPHRRTDGRPDCLVMFSGGRDSSFALHYAKAELGLNPIAYSYDWGVLTDLGRRNQARMLGKLGVEHGLVAADVPTKRGYVRKNLRAWLKRPDLGLIPILMAGDKQYFYYVQELKKRTGINLVLIGECPLERSPFKVGFTGINPASSRIFDMTRGQKVRLAAYYGRRYLANPGYLNGSLWDTFTAYLSSFFVPHDYTFLYDYLRWDEEEIGATLIDRYGWEIDPETPTTWRIGDGTAAFYNYIYYWVAGFTENDNLRSNQVREGVMSRDEALARVAVENRPRPESMRWYAETIGFDLDQALAVIHGLPRMS
jgi:asparagine synthetase B (glutamine-hydrolysing)